MKGPKADFCDRPVMGHSMLEATAPSGANWRPHVLPINVPEWDRWAVAQSDR